MKRLDEFERNYKCQVKATGTYISTCSEPVVQNHIGYDVIHTTKEPLYQITLPLSQLEHMLYDYELIIEDMELQDKHIELQKAYHQYLMLKALYN